MVEHKTQDKIFLHKKVEENEKLGSSGNDIDEVIAMFRGTPGCNEWNRPDVAEWYRFDKNYNNRAYSSHEVTLQNVLNNGQKANSQEEIGDSSNGAQEECD